MKIKKGCRFVCIEDVLMEDDGEVNYVKGDVYISEQDGAITNMLGEKGHLWSRGEECKQHFIPYYQLDKVYTKHTPLLEKIFDKYEGKKVATKCKNIRFFDNVTVGDTGWFVSTSRLDEDYYQERGYTYLSEKAFIEFMDLGKYVGSLNVEREGFTKKELEIVGDVIDKCIYGEEEGEQEDMVNNPSHYTKGGIECIDAIKASMSSEAFKGFLKGQILKYSWRYESKFNPLEDLKKMMFYGDRLIKELENES